MRMREGCSLYAHEPSVLYFLQMPLSDDTIQKIREIFSRYPSLMLAYLFGSQANGTAGIMSDYDFAIYFKEKNTKKNFDIKLELIAKLSMLLKSDNIDIVLLNDDISSELKYTVIKEGKIIFEKNDFRIIAEPRILNEFFDFSQMLKRHNLTKAQ